MAENLRPIWDDDHFTVETGVIPSRLRFSGADLGPGIIYYPVDANLRTSFAEKMGPAPAPRRSLSEPNVFWNAGFETEILNPEEKSYEFVRVGLKPPAPAMSEIPDDFVGIAYASLLQADWDQPFKESVRDDLDIIATFVEPLLRGQQGLSL